MLSFCPTRSTHKSASIKLLLPILATKTTVSKQQHPETIIFLPADPPSIVFQHRTSCHQSPTPTKAILFKIYQQSATSSLLFLFVQQRSAALFSTVNYHCGPKSSFESLSIQKTGAPFHFNSILLQQQQQQQRQQQQQYRTMSSSSASNHNPNLIINSNNNNNNNNGNRCALKNGNNNYLTNHCIDAKHHMMDGSIVDGGSSNGHSTIDRNGDTSLHYSLDQIREQLRQCDPNCNGHLELNLNDETGVGTLCINSPQRKNAFSGFMMAQFSDLLDQLEKWTKGQVIIIYGADSFFCSGADLKTIRQNNLSDQCGAYFISEMMHSNLTRLERLPIVSVALIEGKALGGGAEIITACDFRVAVADAKIGFVHARLGVTPGFGGGTRLLRLVGATRALQLMLSAKLIDSNDAQQSGLVQHVLDAGIKGADALQATIEWYRANYGTITPFASRAIKSIVANGLENVSTTQALQAESKIFCSVWGREEHKQALASNIKHHK